MNQPPQPSDLRAELIRRVADLQEEEAPALVQTRLANADDPLGIVEDCQEGLRQVRFTGHESGVVLLGTVAGDIHDIGKNSLSLLLTSYGFNVHDLGVDVPAADFLAAATIHRPHIIGLSGLLTSSYDAMRDTIRLLRSVGDPAIAALPIITGGNQLNQQVWDYIGADAWVTEAMSGVRLCQRLTAGAVT